MTLKLDFKDMEMKPYIILDRGYAPNRRSYVTSLAMTSTHFDTRAIHTSEKLYNFYGKDKDYEIVFVEDALEHEYFSELIKELERSEDSLRREHTRVFEALEMLNDLICKPAEL